MSSQRRAVLAWLFKYKTSFNILATVLKKLLWTSVSLATKGGEHSVLTLLHHFTQREKLFREQHISAKINKYKDV